MSLKRRTILDSFNNAIDGVTYTLKTQRNMRIHFAAAVAILVAALFFKLSKVEVLVLFITISLVLIAELINTSIETVVDLVTQEFHPLARRAKHLAAGAVLVAALNAVIVGYLLFFDRISEAVPLVYQRVIALPPYLTFVALIMVILFVIIGKVRTGSNSLRGGMPSGHTAIAFSIATAVFFLSQNGLVITLTLLLSLLTAESRWEAGIHSVREIVTGALIGILLTVAVFQLYRF
mgnify:CR=1 FL=1